ELVVLISQPVSFCACDNRSPHRDKNRKGECHQHTEDHQYGSKSFNERSHSYSKATFQSLTGPLHQASGTYLMKGSCESLKHCLAVTM
ncbi:unnamed protein product, partial [Staurois parvus]